jgi:hypothetical protein
MSTCTPSTRTEGDDTNDVDVDAAQDRSPRGTASPYRDAMRDVPTTYGDRKLARGHRRSPAALHAVAAYRYADL